MPRPLLLKNFAATKVRNLREGINLLYKGEAIVFYFEWPMSFFIGYIPEFAKVVWRNYDSETLHWHGPGYTYFTWNHSCETLINTGLITYRFQLGQLDIDVTFYIFNPQKFVISIKIEDLYDIIMRHLYKCFNDQNNKILDTNQMYRHIAKHFFIINDDLSQYGIAVTLIDPVKRTGMT